MAMPAWFTILSILMLALGISCSLMIVVDEVMGHSQHMWIMNVVWPMTALFGTIGTVWAYFKYGRLATHRAVMDSKTRGEEPPNKRLTPFPVMVAKGSAHCGAGCAIGDIVAESLAATFPIVLTWVGWKSWFPDTHAGKIFAGWMLDYLFAVAIGVGFQYLTIVPMRGLSMSEGLLQAFKADVLSLTAWQIGMYGVMALSQFVIFVHVMPHEMTPGRPEFWFVMQIAMLAGFATSYPVNWWLLRSGIKEQM